MMQGTGSLIGRWVHRRELLPDMRQGMFPAFEDAVSPLWIRSKPELFPDTGF